jgi:hypothetical protein
MLEADRTERIRVLQAAVQQVWQQAQRLGSGATIHLLVSRISTARGALSLAEERQAWDSAEHLELLLALAEESLQAAQVLIAQSQHGA